MSHLSTLLAPKLEGINLAKPAAAIGTNESFLLAIVSGTHPGLWLSTENAIRLGNYLGMPAREILHAQMEDQIEYAAQFGTKEDEGLQSSASPASTGGVKSTEVKVTPAPVKAGKEKKKRPVGTGSTSPHGRRAEFTLD